MEYAPPKGTIPSERVPQFLIGHDLQERIVAQAVGVIGVLIASDDLIEALPQQGVKKASDNRPV